MPLETQISDLVNDIVKLEPLDDAFRGYIVSKDDEPSAEKKKGYLDQFKKIISGASQTELVESALKHYVHLIFSQSNLSRTQFLFDLLEMLIDPNSISPKMVCDIILTSEKLNYQNSATWCMSFALIRRNIGGVDYKGVRDMLKIIFERAQSIPALVNVDAVKQLEAVQNVIAYIFDSNTCLLPRYFVVNEIRKLFPDDIWPHWKLAPLLSDFVESFRATAQMVSISGRTKLLPVVTYHSGSTANVWKLDPITLRFSLKGALPFDKDFFEPQTSLLRYVLEQPYSRDMVCNMLGLNKQHKQRCPVLEEQLVDLVILAMERSENDIELAEGSSCMLLWQHLTSQLIFFVLFQFASFPIMVNTIHDKLAGRNLRKGRDHLMWILLQFISGSIQKNPLSDFLPVLKLYDLLYPEREVLLTADITKSSATQKMAITCIWIHLLKKAQNEKVKLERPLPHSLKGHLDLLQQSLRTKNLTMSDYRIALLCNAYSTNQEYFPLPMAVLVETIYGNQKSTTPLPGPPTCVAAGPTTPLHMNMLDSLTVHAKMSLIHNIVTHVIKQAQTKSTLALAPALVETYSRLLVYMEIESLGIKGFISQLMPNVFKSHAWGILHTLLEMFSYRLHHIQPHYRVQLLSHLHSLAAVPQTNHSQLHLCVESTALRLITGLGSAEVWPQLSRFLNEPKTLLSAESEELNRALVLTLARAMHVTGSETLSGNWCKDILTAIMQNTPHTWSSFTLSCFPPVLNDFFQQYNLPKENKNQLKKNVEEEYRKWKSMSNENDCIAHFSLQGTPPLFLCLLWKMLLESDRVNPIAYKVLERIGARALSGHLRTFADFLVFEFATSVGGNHVNKCIDALNDLIWKCNVVTLDRLVLCLALKSFEGNEAQVCFFIIQLLLLKHQDFRNRVNEFVKENSPEHWVQNNWHEKHMAFHRKYPEKYFFEGLQDMPNQTSQHPYLPVYFGNVCLRFLPVFDIVIHRFLELPPVAKSLETLLDHLGGLYKFHDRPITYLYNTLHYYERKLKDRPPLKRKLVSTIVGALKDIHPADWCLTEAYQKYATRSSDDVNWIPELEYYIKLIGRVVDTINGTMPPPFPNTDWRFNEFPNPAAHALHVSCVELMALPVASHTVGNCLLDIVLKSHSLINRAHIESWMNAIGLVLTSLPESFWMVLNDRILEMLQSSLFTILPNNWDPFKMFHFSTSHAHMSENQCCYLLALTHTVWHHSSIGQLSLLPQFFKEKVKPIIKTEQQFLYLCHLIGPFLQRFHQERTRCLLELTVELYEVLEAVDKASEHLMYMDPICDLLYHIKYMFTGDSVKTEVEKIIRNLRLPLQLRLRFITHISLEEAVIQ